MSEHNKGFYLAVPSSDKGAGVLVLHAWWGLNDFFRNFCDRLAREGFVALAPDMFSGKVVDTIEEAEYLVNHLNGEKDVPPIILPALEKLLNHPSVDGKGLGVIGFSFGAAWALWLDQHRPEWIRAVTLFYGTNGGSGNYFRSKASFLGHFAERDPYEPDEIVDEVERLLKENHRPTNFYKYPGTGHWFAEEDRPDAYNAAAAGLAWERTVAFLHDRLDGNGA